MHHFVLGTYRFALRSQGSYMLFLVGVSFFGLPIFAPAELIGAPLLITLLGLGTGALLVKSQWQPSFLKAPEGVLKGMGAMLASSVIFLIALFLGYVAILNIGIEEPMSRNLSMLTALPTTALTGLMWLSALVLITSKPPSATPPAPRWTPPARSEEVVDLRDLRKSRTA